MFCLADLDKVLAVLMKGEQRGCQKAEPTPTLAVRNLLCSLV